MNLGPGVIGIHTRDTEMDRDPKGAWRNRAGARTAMGVQALRVALPLLLALGHELDDFLDLIVQRPFPRRLHPLACPLDGLLEPCGLDRLQQVVDRVHFEGFDSMAIEGGDEDDIG